MLMIAKVALFEKLRIMHNIALKKADYTTFASKKKNFTLFFWKDLSFQFRTFA